MVALPYIALVGIFLLGCVVGWLISRVRGRLQFGVNFTDVQEKPGRLAFRSTQKFRTMQIRCKCGAVWKFQDNPGTSDPGTLPMLQGDSFVCPKCGAVADLAQIRSLMKEARPS